MKPKMVIGVVIIIAALVYLFIGGFKDNAIYYLTIPELHAKGLGNSGEGLRVSGYVVPHTIQWDAQKVELRFVMTEQKDTLNVFYHGVMPDQLAAAQQVLVEGKLGTDGTLLASKILLKCPSKYEAKKNE
jgi:cytochrome c-type biogenesis protein CcmE